jgi:TolB protein
MRPFVLSLSRFAVITAAVFVVCCGGGAHSEEPAVITVRKSAALIDLAVNPLAGAEGAAATKTLTTDLNLASAFQLSATAAGASYTARGAMTAGGLQGQLVDRSGATLLNKTYNGTPQTAAHQFADDIVLALTRTHGIAGSKIAFIGTRTGRKEVYTCDADGGNLRQLTSDNSISVGPALSPDGRRLAYTGYKSGYADIYLIDLATGARSRIVKFPGTNTGAAFSADGSRLAMTCSKDGNPELYITDLNGGNAQRLTHTPSVEGSPTWSPDGSELIYESDASGPPLLYRISTNGGTGRLVPTGFGYCTEPNWSPDGKKIAFNVRGGGGFQAAVLELGSGSAHVVAAGDAENPVWGADSRHLIYSDGEALYMLDVPTGKRVRIIGGVGKLSEPTWSR